MRQQGWPEGCTGGRGRTSMRQQGWPEGWSVSRRLIHSGRCVCRVACASSRERLTSASQQVANLAFSCPLYGIAHSGHILSLSWTAGGRSSGAGTGGGVSAVAVGCLPVPARGWSLPGFADATACRDERRVGRGGFASEIRNRKSEFGCAGREVWEVWQKVAGEQIWSSWASKLRAGRATWCVCSTSSVHFGVASL